MDGLTDTEKKLSWAASWDPSFDGVAIVNKDFTFRSVNPQFCEIVGVSPAELLGRRFQDITPISVKQLDENNAKLVMEGKIESYLLPKSYEFTNGSKVDIILLVKGVYNETGEFLFFLSRIMLDTEVERSHIPSQKQPSLMLFIKEYHKIFIGVGTAIGAFMYSILQFLNKDLVN